MAWTITTNSDDIVYDYKQFTADTPADVQDLPTDCAAGSVCVVVSPFSVYMLNNQHIWYSIT